MLKTIVLELARNPGAPEGDSGHRYVFRAPVDAEGFLDRSAWDAARTFCTVKKFEHGEESESGLLILTRKDRWVFSYRPGDEDDEAVFRLDDRRFLPGDYLSVTEHDGVQRTFKVAAVTDWQPGGVAQGRWPSAGPRRAGAK